MQIHTHSCKQTIQKLAKSCKSTQDHKNSYQNLNKSLQNPRKSCGDMQTHVYKVALVRQTPHGTGFITVTSDFAKICFYKRCESKLGLVPGGGAITVTPVCMKTNGFNIATPFWKEFGFQKDFKSKFVSGWEGGGYYATATITQPDG